MKSAYASRRFYESVLSIAVLAVIAPLAAGAAGNSPNAADPSASADAAEVRVVLAPNSAFEQEVRSADGTLIEAIADNDALAAAALLSSEFAWIDRDGRSRSKSDVVNRIVLLSAGADTNIRLRTYGRLALLTGTHLLSPDNAPAFFARIWIRQPSGWRLLLYQETAAADFPAKNARFGITRAQWPAACDNPCRWLPYKALSSEAQEIVAAFMADEKASYEGDAAAEGRILGDDVLFVTPDRSQPMHKAERIAEIDDFAHALQVDPPPPVASMALWVFGDAAVMSADQESATGEKLCTTRIWARRNGRWQITFSQQTQVQ
jgi:hypothetical protein